MTKRTRRKPLVYGKDYCDLADAKTVRKMDRETKPRPRWRYWVCVCSDCCELGWTLVWDSKMNTFHGRHCGPFEEWSAPSEQWMVPLIGGVVN